MPNFNSSNFNHYKDIEQIRQFLNSELKNLPIQIYTQINSTNLYLKEQATTMKSNCLIVAHAQSKGQGQRGKSFFSPANSGLYLSLLLKPCAYSTADAWKLTIMSAVAMSQALEEISEKNIQLKWVNDLFIEGKKIGGILTESAIEKNKLIWAIIGVGVNLYAPEHGFPDNLSSVASSLFPYSNNHSPEQKNRIIASFLNYFYGFYKSKNSHWFNEYKKRSCLIGKQIKIYLNLHSSAKTKEQWVKVLDIDDQGRLVVESINGEIFAYQNGEITLQL